MGHPGRVVDTAGRNVLPLHTIRSSSPFGRARLTGCWPGILLDRRFHMVCPVWTPGVTWVPSGCHEAACRLLIAPLLDPWRRPARSRGAGGWVGTGPVSGGVGADLVTGAAGRGEDEFRSRVGAAPLRLGQHAGVRVGGDHDAGVAQQILRGLQVRAGLVGERGGAVPEVAAPPVTAGHGSTSCGSPSSPASSGSTPRPRT